ncbi:MAG: HAD family hydrolase [Verrucomicrobiia bacterium]
MTPPKAVIFDLGKVLLDFDYGIAVTRLQQRCRVSLAELQTLINQSPLLLQYEANRLSTAQFFAEIQGASGFCGTFEEFREGFEEIFSAVQPMIELHRELRARKVPTYVFSNTNEIAVQHIRERFPFFRNFDGYILSYEHNGMKPEPRLYEVVERTAGFSGPDLLYIDDRPENIETGRQRGWRTILHTAPELTRAAIIEVGLLPEGRLTPP